MHPLYVAAIGRTDLGVRLLHLVSHLQTRGGMKMGLTLIVPQQMCKDTLNTCAKTSSILYYRQPLSLAEGRQTSNKIFSKTHQVFATDKISGCYCKNYLLIWTQYKRELNYVFLMRPIILKLKKPHLLYYSLLVSPDVGVKIKTSVFMHCFLIESTGLQLCRNCWCLHYFELSRRLV